MPIKEQDSIFAAVAVETGLLKPVGLLAAAARCGAEPGLSLAEAVALVGAMTAAQVAEVEKVVAHRQQLAATPIGTLASFGGFDPAPDAEPAEASDPLESFGGSPGPTIAATPGAVSGAPIGATPTLAGADGKATVAGPSPAGRQLDDAVSITAENPGRYEVQAERGRGGIGRVLIALDQHLGREIAVKELLRGADHGDAATRFLREARITGRLEHPGIIPVYELGRRADNSLYYTMKLVRGETLSDRLAAAASLPERLRLLPHFLDLCQAIAYAHDQGVLHRDLKPQNVMVGKFGETVVLDWGLAKVKGVADERAGDLEAASRLMKEAGASTTVQGRLLGTPAYMAPEQAEGLIDQVDERSDVWSLGAILYELLTGRRAYDGASAWEVVGKVLAGQPEPIASIEPAAPRELIAIAEKCLTRDRDRRYQHAGELAEDVARFQSGGLVSAYDYSMATLVKRWVKKRWPVLATAAAALVVLMVVGIFSYVSIREQRNIAVEQRSLAEQREKEANQNLAEAYVQYGMQAEKENRWNDARLLFARALALSGRENARSGLYREAVRPRRVLLQRTIKTDQRENIPVAISPDGRYLVTGGCQQIEKRACVAGVAQVWKTESGEQVGQLNGPTDMVSAVAYAPDGQSVAIASWDGSARVFDSRGGGELRSLTGHAGATSVLFSPDSQTLITAGDEGEIKTWTAAGDPLATLSGHEGGAIAAALSADGKRLLTGSADHTVRLWDLDSGAAIWTSAGDTQWVRAVALSPDGKTALSGGNDRILKLWSTVEGKKLADLPGHTGPVIAVAFLPDGTAVSAGDDGDLRFWDLVNRRCTDIVRAHSGRVRALTLTADGHTLITTGADGAIKIWSLAESAGITAIAAHEGPVSALAYSPDGKSLLSGGLDHQIKLWREGKLVREFVGHTEFVRALAFAPDGKTFASASWDETVRVWDLETGECRKVLQGHKGNINSIAFADKGKKIVSAGDDATLRVWDSQTGREILSQPAGEKPVSSVSVQGNSVLAGSWDGRLLGFSLRDKLEPFPSFEVNKSGIAGVARPLEDFCRLAVIGFDGAVSTGYRCETKKKDGTITPPPAPEKIGSHDCDGSGITWIGKTEFIASSGCDGIRLWSYLSRGPVAWLPADPKRKPASIAASGDGKLVASGTEGGEIIIFALPDYILETPGKNLYRDTLAQTGLSPEGFYPRAAQP